MADLAPATEPSLYSFLAVYQIRLGASELNHKGTYITNTIEIWIQYMHKKGATVPSNEYQYYSRTQKVIKYEIFKSINTKNPDL